MNLGPRGFGIVTLQMQSFSNFVEEMAQIRALLGSLLKKGGPRPPASPVPPSMQRIINQREDSDEVWMLAVLVIQVHVLLVEVVLPQSHVSCKFS